MSGNGVRGTETGNLPLIPTGLVTGLCVSSLGRLSWAVLCVGEGSVKATVESR